MGLLKNCLLRKLAEDNLDSALEFGKDVQASASGSRGVTPTEAAIGGAADAMDKRLKDPRNRNELVNLVDPALRTTGSGVAGSKVMDWTAKGATALEKTKAAEAAKAALGAGERFAGTKALARSLGLAGRGSIIAAPAIDAIETAVSGPALMGENIDAMSKEKVGPKYFNNTGKVGYVVGAYSQMRNLVPYTSPVKMGMATAANIYDRETAKPWQDRLKKWLDPALANPITGPSTALYKLMYDPETAQKEGRWTAGFPQTVQNFGQQVANTGRQLLNMPDTSVPEVGESGINLKAPEMEKARSMQRMAEIARDAVNEQDPKKKAVMQQQFTNEAFKLAGNPGGELSAKHIMDAATKQMDDATKGKLLQNVPSNVAGAFENMPVASVKGGKFQFANPKPYLKDTLQRATEPLVAAAGDVVQGPGAQRPDHTVRTRYEIPEHAYDDIENLKGFRERKRNWVQQGIDATAANKARKQPVAKTGSQLDNALSRLVDILNR